MNQLVTQFNTLAQFPNGAQVARKIAQLHDLSLDPQNEYLSHTIKKALRLISSRAEEELMRREFFDIVQEGKTVEPFIDSLETSSDAEWKEFKREIDLQPIRDKNKEVARLSQFESGLIKDEEFSEWVLGEKEKSPHPEIES